MTDGGKATVIHEPLVPRTFRLLGESEKEGNGLVTYGLEDPSDNSFTNWNGSILLDDGRFYQLKLVCGPKYPNEPPEVKFISKINVPFVDQSNGKVKNTSLKITKEWTRKETIETLLMFIREEIKNNINKFKQPPEGATF